MRKESIVLRLRAGDAYIIGVPLPGMRIAVAAQSDLRREQFE
tara:strand:- start:1416 stop:1541 length:126 start_codon:yes stop_codon:yes gene_type:complete